MPNKTYELGMNEMYHFFFSALINFLNYVNCLQSYKKWRILVKLNLYEKHQAAFKFNLAISSFSLPFEAEERDVEKSKMEYLSKILCSRCPIQDLPWNHVTDSKIKVQKQLLSLLLVPEEHDSGH